LVNFEKPKQFDGSTTRALRDFELEIAGKKLYFFGAQDEKL